MPAPKRTKIEDTGGGNDLHDFEEGDLTATYLGFREITTKYSVKTTDPLTGEVHTSTKKVHDFQKADGEKVSVFGRAMLDRLLMKVEVGTLIEVVETGKVIKTKGGGKMTEYEVYAIEA